MTHLLSLYSLITGANPMIINTGRASDIEKDWPLSNELSRDGLKSTMMFMNIKIQPVEPTVNEMIAHLPTVKEVFVNFEGFAKTKKFDFLNRALEFYHAGISRNSSNALIDFVTCLESLFSDSNPNESISYKLANRVTVLLSNNDSDLVIYKAVKRAYNLRSSFVHGSISKIPQGEKEKIQDIVANALSESITLSARGMNKQQITDLLDEALNSPAAKRKLRKLLAARAKPSRCSDSRHQAIIGGRVVRE
jgi:hypothetical protein